jgi:hypothetical protein
VSALSKAEVAKAVTAIRDLTEIVEKLNKAAWPEAVDNDVLRKAELQPPRPTNRAQLQQETARLADRVVQQDATAERILQQIEEQNARIDALLGKAAQ